MRGGRSSQRDGTAAAAAATTSSATTTTAVRAAHANEFVQLAAELSSCMAFEPKRWRNVLDKSNAVLHAPLRDASRQLSTSSSLSRIALSGKTRHLRASKRKSNSRNSDARPSSRNEDDESTALPSVHFTTSHHAPMSVASYLHQPALVRAILEAEMAPDDVDVASSRDATGATLDDEADERSDEEGALSAHTAARTSSISNDACVQNAASPLAGRLPLLSTMSPRTRRGLARLPAPSANDLDAIDAFERFAASTQRTHALYRALEQQQQSVPLLRNASGRKQRTTAVAAQAPALSPLPVARRRAALAVPTHARSTTRDEQACMAMEDVNANDLALPIVALAVSAHGATSGTAEHLRREQASAVAAEHVAQQHVAQTLVDIRQLLPLELVYAFGHGAFASPAQQRAAVVLARASMRLRFARVAHAMQQWQRVTALTAQLEAMRATLCIQCAWRQTLAVRELEARRCLRRELERRQRHLLQLLASKQNAAANVITRALREYVRHCAAHRRELQTAAAKRIQTFWRKRQALWVALRIRLRRQQRDRAAVCIQRYARGRLARRACNLRRKLQRVDAMRQRREQLAASRALALQTTGAALLLQRTVRKWQRRRVLTLRRRRAQFERDKRMVVKVQAHWRGRVARQWVRVHAQAVQRAVLTLQRAWRCYAARCRLAALQQQRAALRRVYAAEIAERRRRTQHHSRAAQQAKKTWNHVTAIKDKVVGSGSGSPSSTSGPTAREVRAAVLLQARWRGVLTRRRLRYRAARRREQQRRAVNRSRRLAATCIQRRVRGVQGRSQAWTRMVHRSASRIQSAWRGLRTRRALVQTRRALQAITRMQQQWRQRRKRASERQRERAATAVQRRARVWLARRWLRRAVQRQQLLAEEHAMGAALLAATRARVNDELLLQSFVHRSVAFTDGSSTDDSDAVAAMRVDRSLFRVDRSSGGTRVRRGYDGVWQELFRVASGGAREIDNSRFVRFLKALPHAFVDKTRFPTQTLDVVFAKMKEPKARTLSFARFTAAMLVVWRDRFAPAPTAATTTVRSSGAPAIATSSVHDHDDQARFLRFMHTYVLQPSVHHGKLCDLLDAHCTQRMLWAVHVLRRVAGRIAASKHHAAFQRAHAQAQHVALQHASACAIASCYRRFHFRRQLGALLARMFVEYVDHTGRAIRFEHVETKKVVNGKRPQLLAGVTCARVVPLPFPGEEFRAFCTRHEDSSIDSNVRVAAAVYCIECEDALCTACFRRDHAKRAAFARHATHAIRVCSHCCIETATRECLHCGDGHVPFCDACFPHVHAAAAVTAPRPTAAADALPNKPLATHAWTALVVMCVECTAHVAQWRCTTCADVYCKRCLGRTHARGQRQYHECVRLSYFTVLQQRAELTRVEHAQVVRIQRDNERADAKAQRQRDAQHRHASATVIQALARGFVARRRGRAYMKLVRQTQAARAQRIKDDRVRALLVYRVQRALGMSPALRSDTTQETTAQQQRLDAVKRRLFLHRRIAVSSSDDTALTLLHKPTRRRWTKAARAHAERAARTWCVFDARVVVRSGPWRGSVGAILSTQHVLTTGHVVVFVALAHRAVVVSYEQLVPFDDVDAAARAPYVPPHRVLADAAHDLRVHVMRTVDTAVRRARLLYLQRVEFRAIAHVAWVADVNRNAQRVEYWNVVLNARALEPPRAMELVEHMDEAQREALDARVAVARTKLLALLHPFVVTDKPALLQRRHARVYAHMASHAADSSNNSAAVDEHVDALRSARFWHETIVPHATLGGARARAFLHACRTTPLHSSASCWCVLQLWQYMELYDRDGYEPLARIFLRLGADAQLFVSDELAPAIAARDHRSARDKLQQLLQLKHETLQLLVFNAAQQRTAAQDAAVAEVAET